MKHLIFRNRIGLFFIYSCILLVGIQCSKDAANPAVTVASVSVTPTAIAALTVGATQTLTATVLPNTVKQTVTWTSSDERKATVSSNGEVTAKAIGTVTITAKSTEDGTKTATCSVTVVAAASADPCATNSSKYTADVSPIIVANCATAISCHAAGGRSPVLTNYSQVSTNKSKISSEVSSGRMPQGGTLTADQKNKIICWINAGALDN